MTSLPPENPVPKRVYARRRLTVLLVALAGIAIVALVIWKPGSTSSRPSSQVPAPPSASQSAPAEGEGSASGTPSPSASGDAEAGATACDPKNIVVSAITDSARYAEGAEPQLKMSITNTGGSACTLNVGTNKQVFTISSGTERYWTSTDCQTEPSAQVSEIESGQTVESGEAIVWDRTRSSAETCDAERTPVPTGASYHLSVTIDGIESRNTKQFQLD